MAKDTQFQDFIDELKLKCNIETIVSKYIHLEKKGRNLWGCCPFHHEKTASFSVNVDGGYYHCFGCGVSGDVIKFVQEIESVDFFEALKILAPQVGMTVPEIKNNSNNSDLKQKKDKMLAMMKDVANYFHTNLSNPKANTANEYLKLRQLDKNIVKAFGIGCSLDYQSVITFLKSKGYTQELMFEAGIIDNKNNKYYDAVANRLIFPICNVYGQVIAFGGRVLGKTDFAKYKNSKETMLFVKNRVLYGLHLVKKLKREQAVDSIIMVEGYMDTIALYKAGFKNVVASMGTSLTEYQAKLLKRHTDNVIISYDGDGAGQKATLRGLDILYKEGLNVKVVSLPEGLDPDDVIKKYGADKYQQLIDSAKSLFDYKLDLLLKYIDVKTEEGKGKYAKEGVRILREANNNIAMEPYLNIIVNRTGVALDTLKYELHKNSNEASRIIIPSKATGTAYDIAIKYILYFMIYEKIDSSEVEELILFSNKQVYIDIFNIIKNIENKEARLIVSKLLEIQNQNNSKEISEIVDFPNAPNDLDKRKYFDDCVKLILKLKYSNKINSLKTLYDSESSSEKRKEITKEIFNLKHKIGIL